MKVRPTSGNGGLLGYELPFPSFSVGRECCSSVLLSIESLLWVHGETSTDVLSSVWPYEVLKYPFFCKTANLLELEAPSSVVQRLRFSLVIELIFVGIGSRNVEIRRRLILVSVLWFVIFASVSKQL